MKHLFFLLFLLFSCQSKHFIFIPSVDSDNINTISYIHSQKSYSISLQKRLVLPSKFPIITNRVQKWIDSFNDMKFSPNPSSQFSLAGISFNHIVVNGKVSSWSLKGSKLDKNWSYLITTSYVEKKRSQKAGYISTDQYNNIFIDLNTLRSPKFLLPSAVQNIQYNDQLLSPAQVKLFKNLLNDLSVISYAYDGEPKVEALINRLSLGKAINNNVPGLFLLTTPKGQYRLLFGRPSEEKPILRAWLEGSHQVVDLKFTKWVKFKRFVAELLKNK